MAESGPVGQTVVKVTGRVEVRPDLLLSRSRFCPSVPPNFSGGGRPHFERSIELSGPKLFVVADRLDPRLQELRMRAPFMTCWHEVRIFGPPSGLPDGEGAYRCGRFAATTFLRGGKLFFMLRGWLTSQEGSAAFSRA